MTEKLEPLAVGLSEAARLLNISRPTIYRWANLPGFPVFRVGGRVLVSVDGLRNWVQRQMDVSE